MSVQCGKTYLFLPNLLPHEMHMPVLICMHTHTQTHTHLYNRRHANRQNGNIKLNSTSHRWRNTDLHFAYTVSKNTPTTSHYAGCELWWAWAGRWQTTCLLWIWMKLCMSYFLWHDSFIPVQAHTNTGRKLAHRRLHTHKNMDFICLHHVITIAALD